MHCLLSGSKRVGWPVPHTLIDEDCQEVVYMIMTTRMVGDVDPGVDVIFTLTKLLLGLSLVSHCPKCRPHLTMVGAFFIKINQAYRVFSSV